MDTMATGGSAICLRESGSHECKTPIARCASPGLSGDHSNATLETASRCPACRQAWCPPSSEWTTEAGWEGLSEAAFRRRVTKNVVCVGLTFLVLFAGFLGLTYLQGSLHRAPGLGVLSQGVLYLTMILSSLFLPKLAALLLGYRHTMAIAITGYVLWMLANGHATWVTMTVTSAIVGLMAAPLWSAQCAYVTVLVQHFCRLFHKAEAKLVPVYFGLFSLLFKSGCLLGSVISWVVLLEREHNETPPYSNESAVCGAANCPWDDANTQNNTSQHPESHKVWTLLAVYVALGVAAIVIVCTCVDPIPASWMPSRDPHAGRAVWHSLTAASRLHTEGATLLLLPLAVMTGLRYSFTVAMYLKWYVACSLGIWMVGFVSLPCLAIDILVCYLSGRLTKAIGRAPVFAAAFLLEITFYLVALFWYPDQSQLPVFLAISSLQGVAEGIWGPQIPALYGLQFPDSLEAAFASFRLWQSLGMVVGFVTSRFLCVHHAIALNLTVVGVAGGCFLGLQLLNRRRHPGGSGGHQGAGTPLASGEGKAGTPLTSGEGEAETPGRLRYLYKQNPYSGSLYSLHGYGIAW